jgi:hypothetical protein
MVTKNDLSHQAAVVVGAVGVAGALAAGVTACSSGDSGKIDFTEGSTVTVTAPPASQTMSGSQLGF